MCGPFKQDGNKVTATDIDSAPVPFGGSNENSASPVSSGSFKCVKIGGAILYHANKHQKHADDWVLSSSFFIETLPMKQTVISMIEMNATTLDHSYILTPLIRS